MNEPDRFESPLATRYASPAMQRAWGPRRRARLWRELWLTLAQVQRELGLPIPEEALGQMRDRLDDADLTRVREYERRFRHDVMAHVHHFGDQAPAARPFIHLGATSAYVTDNADLLVIRDALRLVLGRLRAVLEALRTFATAHATRPTVAYTHFQPAQLTTVGKRATLWMQDLLMDGEAVRDLHDAMPFRGCKGTTGTQASYLELFGGDHEKVRALDREVTARFGFSRPLPVTGQTYTRKLDSRVLDVLSGIAQSAAKLATDVRLLQHEGEILEPAEREQIGSSAMAYKRNPMRTERVCSLARFVLSLQQNAGYTVATQWFERTLDDSANRRLVLPEAFLAVDAVLVLLTNVCAGLEVREATIRRNVDRVMPFMATERWMMLGVTAGGDRQTLHEVVRQASRAVADAMESGATNDLLDRLANHEAFARVDRAQLLAELEPERYVGRAPVQVTEFLTETLEPFLDSIRSMAPIETVEVLV